MTDSGNSLTAFNPEYWTGEMQVIFFKENVAIALANTKYKTLLRDGDTWNKPYRSKPFPQSYSSGVDITIKDRFATNEAGTVDTANVVPFYVDDLDKIMNKWDSAKAFAVDGMRSLNNKLDQAISGEVKNALNTVDDGSIGGTAGNAITVSVNNINQVWAAGQRVLDGLNIPIEQRFSLVGGRVLETLRLYLAGRDTPQGDKVGMNGKVMERFGFDIFYSNNVYYTATLNAATNPTAADTVTINGATMEFVADADTVSDDAYLGVLRDGSTVDTSFAALTACINDSGTAGTTYSDPDAENDGARWKLINAGIVATHSTGNDTVKIVGYGDIVVSEGLTATADIWSEQVQHCLFGMKGATDLVVQKSPNIEFRLAEKRLGRYVYPWHLFGKKTFLDMTGAIIDVQVDASSWV